MELWKESLQTALDERLDAAFAELAESNPAVREAVKQQRGASVLVKDHPKYDNELKQISKFWKTSTVKISDADRNKNIETQCALSGKRPTQ